MEEKLYKNGFIIAEMKQSENCIYNAWPLEGIEDDSTAQSLTEEADEKWFTKYDMLEIIPDLEYIKKYKKCCDKLNIDTKVLLIETPYQFPIINENIEIEEILGYDCIGTVGYSYLHQEFNERNIILNKNGLIDKYEDVLKFIEHRKKDIESGLNIENFWEEIPIKISIVKY